MVGALLLSLASIACIELWSYGHSLKGPVAYSSIMHKGLACIVTGFLYCSGCPTSLCGGMFLLSCFFFLLHLHCLAFIPDGFVRVLLAKTEIPDGCVGLFQGVVGAVRDCALFFGHLCCCSISASLKLVLAGGNEQL